MSQPKRILSTKGVVTDRTANDLILAGWTTNAIDIEYSHNATWYDPRSGKAYSISQAEAIRRDRLGPNYTFTND